MAKGRALSTWVSVVTSKPAGDVQSAGQNEAVRDVFAGRTVIARAKGVQRIAHAVHVVEEFAQNATPGLWRGTECSWRSD